MANNGIIAKTYASAYLYSKGNYEKNLVNFIMTADEIDKDSEAFKDIKFKIYIVINIVVSIIYKIIFTVYNNFIYSSSSIL